MSDVIRDIIKNPHRVYLRNLNYWNFLLNSYEGGPDYTNAFITKSSDDGGPNVYVNGVLQDSANISGNLFQHKKERQKDYNARLQMSYYYNFCRPVIDIYTNHLFKEPVIESFESISDEVDTVRNDIDLKGSSIDEFRKQMAEMAQIYGHFFVIVDSPNYDESSILTRRDQIENRAYPYLIIYEPQSLINWALDSFGSPYWILMKENEDVNTDPMMYDKDAKNKCRYKLWTRDAWILYDSDYNQIDAGIHGLGVVPIVCGYNKKSKKETSFLGISEIADISFIARDIYNSCSELKQILRDQTFAILALQGSSDDYDELVVGTSKALLYPQERNAPQYVSPPGENAKNYFDHIDRQVSKIYQLAKIEGGSASFSGTGQSAANQSGTSKAWDFNQTNSSLSDKAGNLEDCENKIWNIFSLWLGKGEFDGSIQYPNEFSIQSLMDDLDEAEKSAKLSLGKTFDLEVRKSIQKKKFPSATEEELEKMAEEAEAKLEENSSVNNRNVQSIFNRIPSLTNANSGGTNGGMK